MSNPYFQFKQFTIWHNQCALKVNTDGVLLGAWAGVNLCSTALDIGTGTGVIAVMLAQRCKALIHAVEIEKDAWNQAVVNASQSPWADRIRVFHGDFLQYFQNCSSRYDLIVSNPPYFSNSLKNPGTKKALARHNESLPFDKLLEGVSRLLQENGRFSVILPAGSEAFEQEAYMAGLYCIRKTNVFTLPGKPVSRVLMEFSKTQTTCQTTGLLIHESSGAFSDAYRNLTREFYLKF